MKDQLFLVRVYLNRW